MIFLTLSETEDIGGDISTETDDKTTKTDLHDFVPPGVGSIDWTWSSSAFTPTLFDFDRSNSGISPDAGITDEFKPLHYFKLYFDEYNC